MTAPLSSKHDHQSSIGSAQKPSADTILGLVGEGKVLEDIALVEKLEDLGYHEARILATIRDLVISGRLLHQGHLLMLP